MPERNSITVVLHVGDADVKFDNLRVGFSQTAADDLNASYKDNSLRKAVARSMMLEICRNLQTEESIEVLADVLMPTKETLLSGGVCLAAEKGPKNPLYGSDGKPYEYDAQEEGPEEKPWVLFAWS